MKLSAASLASVLISSSFISAALSQSQQAPPQVSFFSPQGTVKNVRQVQARFSADMVAFGDPRPAADPFEIDCGGELGKGRWADTQNWIYDFDRDLPGGVRCRFQLKPGLRSLRNVPLAGPRTFEFSTGGPAILRSTPWEGSTAIEENQIFVLQLDAVPDLESVRRHVYFSVEGIVDQIGIRVVTGEDREGILKTLYQYRQREAGEDTLLIQARQTFPQDKEVRLVWDVGVATADGVATSEAQTLPFRTRPAFSAIFECLRENAASPCVPLTSMWLSFSSPVAWKDAERIALRSRQREWKPEKREAWEGEWVYSAQFNGPFPESETFTIHLPAGLKDDSGRPLANADRFPLTVRTADYPPLAKFAADFGILEANADPALPVTLRNLEPELAGSLLKPDTSGVGGRLQRITAENFGDVSAWLRKIRTRTRDDRSTSVFAGEPAAQPRRFTIPKPNGSRAFEVVGIPLPQPGFYVVELESRILGASLLGAPETMYVPAAALVTNLSVHLKWGQENSLVWVTRLDNSEPVSGARVQVFNCEGRCSRRRSPIARVWLAFRICPAAKKFLTVPGESLAGGCW